MKVLCVGMMVCDVLISPVPSEIMKKDCVKINQPVLAGGGDALNVAISLSKLGLKVSIAGRVGNDTNGRFLLSECEKNGIEHANVIIDPTYSTATSFALIDTEGERHFLSENSIFSKIVFEDINQEKIQSADFVYFGSAMALPSMNDDGISRLFHCAHEANRMTIMDAAIDECNRDCNWLGRLSPALSETDIFFPSLEEARLISQVENPKEIAEVFKDFGLKVFGIKLGNEGCFITDFQESRILPGIKNIPVLDTTGAGDSFIAGLICALSHNYDVFDAAAFANAVAALNIGAVGGTAGIPDFKTAQEFFERSQKR